MEVSAMHSSFPLYSFGQKAAEETLRHTIMRLIAYDTLCQYLAAEYVSQERYGELIVWIIEGFNENVRPKSTRDMRYIWSIYFLCLQAAEDDSYSTIRYKRLFAKGHQVFYNKEKVIKQVSKMVFSTMRYALPVYFQDQQVVEESQH